LIAGLNDHISHDVLVGFTPAKATHYWSPQWSFKIIQSSSFSYS